jgi:hypothetical protein
VFSTYAQTSRWAEGAFLAVNNEGFVQDNWRITSRLTLDYGVRSCTCDRSTTLRFQLELPAGAVAALTGAAAVRVRVSEQRLSVRRGQPARDGSADRSDAGSNSAPRDRHARAEQRVDHQRRLRSGQGPVAETMYEYPALGWTPRFGAAWDVTGISGSSSRRSGLFYDRSPANTVYGTVNNPAVHRSVTVRYGELQNLSATGLATEAAPALTVWQYDNKYSASTQWNVGVQLALPFASALDVAYAGQHASTRTPPSIINASISGGVSSRQPEPGAGDVADVDRSDDVVRVDESRSRALLSAATPPSTSSSRSGGGRTTRFSSA